MILIAHRGNFDGSNPAMENNPDYIGEALRMGYQVEIDVRFIDNVFLLGHDKPQYRVEEDFLENEKLWCHAKNYEALERMLKNKNIHCFWHQEYDFTLPSRGFIWT